MKREHIITFCTRSCVDLRMADVRFRRIWDDSRDFDKIVRQKFFVFTMISDFSTRWKTPTCVHLQFGFVEGKKIWKRKKNGKFNFLHFLREEIWFLGMRVKTEGWAPTKCFEIQVFYEKNVLKFRFSMRKYFFLVLLSLDWNLSGFSGPLL